MPLPLEASQTAIIFIPRPENEADSLEGSVAGAGHSASPIQ